MLAKELEQHSNFCCGHYACCSFCFDSIFLGNVYILEDDFLAKTFQALVLHPTCMLLNCLN